MEELQIILTKEDLQGLAKDLFINKIKSVLERNESLIEKTIEGYLQKKDWNQKQTEFERGIDWSIEYSARQAIDIAIKEVNFEKIIYNKAKELLENKDFVETLSKRIIEERLNFDKA